MSRLGDLLLQARLKTKLTPKRAAKLAGVSEQFLLDVEQGKKIIADTKAREILKKYGANAPDDMLFEQEPEGGTAEVKPTPKYEPKLRHSTPNATWMDAFSSLLKKVPVLDAKFKEVNFKTFPMNEGKIDGISADLLFYFTVEDGDMRGFRLQSGDLVLVQKQSTLQDGALMLVKVNGTYKVRKVRKLDATTVELHHFATKLEAVRCNVKDIAFIGRCLRFEATL